MAETDLVQLREQMSTVEQEMILHLINNGISEKGDEINELFLELYAGAGGDEAGLFAADLFAMYTQYALFRGWHCQPTTIEKFLHREKIG